MFGDFNTTRRLEERYNSQLCSFTIVKFNWFIREANFHDIRMGGH